MNADGRYAPSPSGPLHAGNLRTALLAWLFARSQGARLRLRIEDLDPRRSRREHEDGQLAALQALGLDWDGPVIRQSERRERHRQALEQLPIYPCWCTRKEIREAAQAPHEGEMPYPGTCRNQTGEGRPAALRLDAQEATVGFADRLHGHREATVDDFVLWRKDDVPSYNLAVVVDDADTGIGEVVRGEDLLETTPRQVLLQQLLGFATPSYAHVPLVVGPDGERLAKRHRDEGRPLEWMAQSLGLAESGEPVTLDLLLARFDPLGWRP
ncbi:MAG: tRNA glutamyl-Q(34) synthetase GluQRS [Actinomycetota bacterium]|nr:tRNA glutamyl-Q(34) synthetase GluQRS [Actinomycetota bacterium]